MDGERDCCVRGCHCHARRRTQTSTRGSRHSHHARSGQILWSLEEVSPICYASRLLLRAWLQLEARRRECANQSGTGVGQEGGRAPCLDRVGRRGFHHLRGPSWRLQLRCVPHTRVGGVVEGAEGPVLQRAVRQLWHQLAQVCRSQCASAARRDDVEEDGGDRREARGHTADCSELKTGTGTFRIVSVHSYRTYSAPGKYQCVIRICVNTTATFDTPVPLPGMSQKRSCDKGPPLSKMPVQGTSRWVDRHLFLQVQRLNIDAVPGACGVIPDASTFESWTCELCANEKNLEASLVCSSHSRYHGVIYNLGLPLDSQLSPLSTGTTRSKKEGPISTTRYLSTRMQAHGGPGMGTRSLFYIHTRGHLHQRLPIAPCRGRQHDSTVPLDEREHQNVLLFIDS